jgi:hypothetical protein
MEEMVRILGVSDHVSGCMKYAGGVGFHSSGNADEGFGVGASLALNYLNLPIQAQSKASASTASI